MSKDVFEKNIEALKEYYPFIYEKIFNQEQESYLNLNIEKASSGNCFGLSVSRKRGDTVILNSFEDPIAEAENTAKGLNINKGEVRFLIGMGLGYLAKEILSLEDKNVKLFIIEPFEDIFAAALNHVDLTDVIKSEDVLIIVGKDMVAENVSNFMGYKKFEIPLFVKGAKVSYFEGERRISPEVFEYIAREIKEQTDQLKTHIQTNQTTGQVFFKNTYVNLTTALESENLGVIQNAFKDKVVIVAGAGPSLSENIEEIKKYRDKLAIFAVDSAIPVFIKNGIYPDLAGTVDYHEISYDKYREFRDETEKIPLVYHLACSSMTLKPYKCEKKFFVTDSVGFIPKIAHEWGVWTDPPGMAAVSHLMLYSAILSGADRIILCGLDLSYVGLKSYAEGSAMGMNLNLEAMVWDKDVEGESVPTSVQMVGQRRIIEKFINNCSDIKFYNASKGVNIKGAKNIDLDRFLSENRLEKVSSKEIFEKLWKDEYKPSLENILKIIDSELKALQSLRNRYLRNKKVIEKGVSSIKKSSANLVSKVNAACDVYDEVSLNTPQEIAAAAQLFLKDEFELGCDEYKMNMDSSDLSRDEKAIKELEFARKSIQSRIESVLKLDKIYRKLQSRIDSEIKFKEKISKKDNLKEKAAMHCKTGNLFLEHKDYNKAEKSFKDALDLDESNKEALVGLGLVSSHLNFHSDALDSYNKAMALSPTDKIIKKHYQKEVEKPERMLEKAAEYVQSAYISEGQENFSSWAIRICNDIIDIYPDNTKALKLKKLAEEIIEDRQEKNRLLAPFIMKKPEEVFEDIETKLEQEPEDALKILSILKNQNPGRSDVLEMLGLSYFKVGDVEKAENTLIQAANMDEGSLSLKIHLAMIYNNKEEYDQALYYLLDAVEKSTSFIPGLYKSMAEISYKKGMLEDSIEYLKRELQGNPEDIESLAFLGDCYEKKGDHYAAGKIFEIVGKVR